jgi:hypothetical protein
MVRKATMSNGLEIGKQYVTLVKEGQNEAWLDKLFAKDAVSVEAGGPGMDRTARGLEAIRAKSKWWGENHTSTGRGRRSVPSRRSPRSPVHVRHHAQAEREADDDEIGLFTVENGKVTREEFFYPAG